MIVRQLVEDHVDLSVLQPSHVSNGTGDSTTHAMKGGQKLIGELHESKNEVFMNTHAMKGGQKLIGELHESKNEVFMNTILHEASCEGFANTLCFPNRPKWLQAKEPIWFGSGGILGR
jgi:hypothetical protein